MKVVYYAPSCQHVVLTQDVNWTELISLHAKLDGKPCPRCGKPAVGLHVLIDQDDLRETTKAIEREIGLHGKFKAAKPPSSCLIEKWITKRGLASFKARYPIPDFPSTACDTLSQRIGRNIDEATWNSIKHPAKMLDAELTEIRNAIATAWGHSSRFISGIPIGAVNYASPNALTVAVKYSRLPFVAVDFALMTLLHHLIRATLASIDASTAPHGVVPSSSNRLRDIPAELREEDVVERLGIIGLRYFMREVAPEVPYTPLSPEKESAAAAIFWSAKAFIVGHEVGHALMGHLDREMTIGSERRTRVYQRNLQQERDADDFACTLMGMAGLRKETEDTMSPLRKIYRIGPVFTFALFLLIEATAASRHAFFRTYGKGCRHALADLADAPSHPPTRERLERAQARLKEVVPGSGLRLCERIEQLVDQTCRHSAGRVR